MCRFTFHTLKRERERERAKEGRGDADRLLEYSIVYCTPYSPWPCLGEASQRVPGKKDQSPRVSTNRNIPKHQDLTGTLYATFTRVRI